jgi:hypothetical protein
LIKAGLYPNLINLKMKTIVGWAKAVYLAQADIQGK